jgi:hypothetical protein
VLHSIDKVPLLFGNSYDINVLEDIDSVILSSFYLFDGSKLVDKKFHELAFNDLFFVTYFFKDAFGKLV